MKNKLLILLFGVSILTLGSCTGGDNTSTNSVDSNISESLSSGDNISSSDINISCEEESIVISIESIESISLSEEDIISSNEEVSSEFVSSEEIVSEIESNEEVSIEISSETSSNKTGDIDLPFIP